MEELIVPLVPPLLALLSLPFTSSFICCLPHALFLLVSLLILATNLHIREKEVTWKVAWKVGVYR